MIVYKGEMRVQWLLMRDRLIILLLSLGISFVNTGSAMPLNGAGGSPRLSPHRPVLSLGVFLSAKWCSKCKETKEVSEFNNLVASKDGKDRICRKCTKEKYDKNRATHISATITWNRNNKKKCLNNLRNYRKNMSDEQRLRCSVRRKLRYAVEKGKIKRGNCCVCNEPNGIGHHEDYSKPLDVIWVCDKHHKRHHRKEINLLDYV